MPVTHEDVHGFLSRKAQQLAGHPARASKSHVLLVIIGRNKAAGAKEASDAQAAQQEQQELPQ